MEVTYQTHNICSTICLLVCAYNSALLGIFLSLKYVSVKGNVLIECTESFQYEGTQAFYPIDKTDVLLLHVAKQQLQFPYMAMPGQYKSILPWRVRACQIFNARPMSNNISRFLFSEKWSLQSFICYNWILPGLFIDFAFWPMPVPTCIIVTIELYMPYAWNLKDHLWFCTTLLYTICKPSAVAIRDYSRDTQGQFH